MLPWKTKALFSTGNDVSVVKMCLLFYEWDHAGALLFNVFTSQDWGNIPQAGS